MTSRTPGPISRDSTSIGSPRSSPCTASGSPISELHRLTTFVLKPLVLMIALALSVAAGASACSSPQPPLAPTGDTRTVIHARPGELANFGVSGFNPTGEQVIEVTDVELVGLPDSVQVIDVWALLPEESPVVDGHVGGVGALTGDLLAMGYVRHDVTDVRIDPRDDRGWQFIVSVRSSQLGSHSIEGVRLQYRTPDNAGWVFFPYTLELNVQAATDDEA